MRRAIRFPDALRGERSQKVCENGPRVGAGLAVRFSSACDASTHCGAAQSLEAGALDTAFSTNQPVASSKKSDMGTKRAMSVDSLVSSPDQLLAVHCSKRTRRRSAHVAAVGANSLAWRRCEKPSLAEAAPAKSSPERGPPRREAERTSAGRFPARTSAAAAACAPVKRLVASIATWSECGARSSTPRPPLEAPVRACAPSTSESEVEDDDDDELLESESESESEPGLTERSAAAPPAVATKDKRACSGLWTRPGTRTGAAPAAAAACLPLPPSGVAPNEAGPSTAPAARRDADAVR